MCHHWHESDRTQQGEAPIIHDLDRWVAEDPRPGLLDPIFSPFHPNLVALVTSVNPG